MLSILYHGVTSCLSYLYKSSLHSVCDNHQGISDMDSLAKIFYMIVLNSLKLWYYVDQCQAGAQKKSSCLEHVL